MAPAQTMMATPSPLKQAAINQLRFLCFNNTPIEPAVFRWQLGLAAAFTWLAGIGRYWDHPKADLWQTLGLGSLAYVAILSLILWLIVWPLRPNHWSFPKVLLFVCMTSPPAILYAIPVERFMSMGNAQLTNVIFLAVVAIWRVALLLRHLVKAAGLHPLTAVIGMLLPVTAIITTLTILNLEQAVFEIMAGLESSTPTANDAAYGILMMTTLLSIQLLPFAAIGYLIAIVRAWLGKRKPKQDTAA